MSGGRARALLAWVMVGGVVVAAGCSSPGAPPARPPAETTVTPPPSASTSVPATVVPAEFVGRVETVTAEDLGLSWRPECPVAPEDLRRVQLSYWDFGGHPHVGVLVVRAKVADSVVGIFHTLYDQRFPIRSVDPVDVHGGSDDASMAADNTSAFNCRKAVTNGPAGWSAHAYGEAVDVNPVENPYLLDGEVLPPAGAAFLDRSDVRPGMAVRGGPMVTAFEAAGWSWGGDWSGSPDYQHFAAGN